MKENKGFTLIELLGVILIIGVLSLVLVPQIVGQVNKSKTQFSAATLKVLYTAGEIYLDKNQMTYPQVSGNTFCVTLKEIVDQGELESPILDANSGEEISLSKVLKFEVDRRGILMYEEKLYEKDACTQVIN